MSYLPVYLVELYPHYHWSSLLSGLGEKKTVVWTRTIHLLNHTLVMHFVSAILCLYCEKRPDGNPLGPAGVDVLHFDYTDPCIDLVSRSIVKLFIHEGKCQQPCAKRKMVPPSRRQAICNLKHASFKAIFENTKTVRYQHMVVHPWSDGLFNSAFGAGGKWHTWGESNILMSNILIIFRWLFHLFRLENLVSITNYKNVFLTGCRTAISFHVPMVKVSYFLRSWYRDHVTCFTVY